jgi:hypothetical protein
MGHDESDSDPDSMHALVGARLMAEAMLDLRILRVALTKKE